MLGHTTIDSTHALASVLARTRKTARRQFLATGVFVQPIKSRCDPVVKKTVAECNIRRDRTAFEARGDASEYPEWLRCPITLSAFEDPVLCNDGHTYERDAIERWAKRKRTSPVTGELISTEFVSNYAVRKAADEHTGKLLA